MATFRVGDKMNREFGSSDDKTVTKTLRTYIARECGVSFIVNFAINGGLAWLIYRDKHSLPLWGSGGFGQDMVVTAFLLWLLLSVIVIKIHQKKVEAGKLPSIAGSDFTALRRALRCLPQGTWAASTYLALIGVVVCALPILLMLQVFDISAMHPRYYSVFKGLWAGSMAVLATPLAILIPLRAHSFAGTKIVEVSVNSAKRYNRKSV